MKRVLTVILAGVVLGGVLSTPAEAGDRRGHGRKAVRYYSHHDHDDFRRYRGRVYYRPRDIVVIRDYYRPHYRPVPRVVHHYHRGGYLPPGWRKKIVPVPVYLEPHLIPVPHGYHRGFIDGHAVVYNSRGFILDIHAVF